jgi:hypothetical protein
MNAPRPSGRRLEACRSGDGVRPGSVGSRGDSWAGQKGDGGGNSAARAATPVCNANGSSLEPQIFSDPQKVCTKCELPKPRTVEFFPSDGRKRDGLRAECRECIAAKAREWHWANREHSIAVKAAYREANPDRPRERTSSYRIETRERAMAAERANPARVAMERMRKRIQRLVGRNGRRTIGFLGCSSAFLRQHLEAQFLPGMSWANRSAWHIDHIRPLSSFDLSDPDQFRAASHYTNLQPLWAADNLRKGASMPEGLAP